MPLEPTQPAPRARSRAAWVFAALAVVFGGFFVVATPPHDPADEARHHARAWLVSNGRPGVVGRAVDHEAAIPREILRLHPPGHHHTEAQLVAGRFPRGTPPSPPHRVEEIAAAFDGPPAGAEFRYVRVLTPYNPVLYAPYAPAFWLAEANALPVTVALWLARGLGLAAWLAVIAFALRRAPSHRWLIAASALLPLPLFQAASVSADPLTQAAALLFFAEWLRIAAEPSPRSRARGYVGVGLAAFALGLAKPGYAPLALACLGLPGTPARRAAVTAGVFLACAIPTLAWAAVAIGADEPPLVPGADSFGQLRFVLDHPFAAAAAIANTVWADGARWTTDLVGALGHLDVDLPPGATALGLAALALSACLDPGRVPLGARVAALAGAVASIAALLVLAYIGWAEVGADYIPAFQARYLLPILPFALVVLPGVPRVVERPAAVVTAAALAGVLLAGATAMWHAYYR